MTEFSSSDVTLVIPGRNAERTIEASLEAAVPLLDDGLAEIILVDDGSTDRTAEIASRYPISILSLGGRGPGAARNAGWRAAGTPLIWFIDSDCVAEPDALSLLLPHLADETIAGVGGSYGNMLPDSILACLIHEEIVERHRSMSSEVDFLATFNVLYRRDVLDSLGGFDEAFLLAQDAELAYRVCRQGFTLRMEPRSRVRHFHPARLARYLRTQARQGYWRVQLYRSFPRSATGDSYSAWLDHSQPPIAAATIAACLLLPLGLPPVIPVLGAIAVGVGAAPMTLRLVRRLRTARYLLFAPLSWVRAFARAAGMTRAFLSRRVPTAT